MGPTKPPVKWVPGVLYRGLKRLRHEADRLPPTSAEGKNERSYTSTPYTCFQGVYSNFTFLKVMVKKTNMLQLTSKFLGLKIDNNLN
jgi:hypothetical protein